MLMLVPELTSGVTNIKDSRQPVPVNKEHSPDRLHGAARQGQSEQPGHPEADIMHTGRYHDNRVDFQDREEKDEVQDRAEQAPEVCSGRDDNDFEQGNPCHLPE